MRKRLTLQAPRHIVAEVVDIGLILTHKEDRETLVAVFGIHLLQNNKEICVVEIAKAKSIYIDHVPSDFVKHVDKGGTMHGIEVVRISND